MKKQFAIAMAMAVVMAVRAFGAETPSAGTPMDITYVSGTLKAVAENATGTFDTSAQSALNLHFGQEQVSIQYSQIKSCVYREENRFRLGVLATIAVGLLKARTKNHFVTITWTDESGSQVVRLEAPKSRAVGLVDVIRARAPEACKPKPGSMSSCYVFE